LNNNKKGRKITLDQSGSNFILFAVKGKLFGEEQKDFLGEKQIFREL